MTESKVVAVKNCARCGQNHPDGLEFKQFLQPVIDDDGTVWNYWATCPVTGDPILMKWGKENS